MYSIARLEELIHSSEDTLSRYERDFLSEPESLFIQGMIKNTRERLDELRANLAFEKRRREVEVIDLRMIGKVAKVGRLPLELLGTFSKILSDTLHEAGRQYQYGNKNGTKYIDQIKQSIDLKFERLVPGSTRILVTGNTNPDLFGNSILENALTNTFQILNVNDTNGLIAGAEKIGGQSVKKLNELLSVSIKNELEFELEWKAPNDKTFKWEGKKEKVETLSNTLAAIHILPPQQIELHGQLISQSLKGQIEIKNEEKKILKIDFSNALLEQVKSIQIGDDCSCVVSHSVTSNKITGEEKNNYILESITN